MFGAMLPLEGFRRPNDLGCQGCHIEDIGNVNQISFNNPVILLGVGNVNTILRMLMGKTAESCRRTETSQNAI